MRTALSAGIGLPDTLELPGQLGADAVEGIPDSLGEADPHTAISVAQRFT
jgi:hypothetical protein